MQEVNTRMFTKATVCTKDRVQEVNTRMFTKATVFTKDHIN